MATASMPTAPAGERLTFRWTPDAMPAPSFDVTQVLQRAPNLTTVLDSHDEVTVHVGGRHVRFGHQALAVLDLFAHPQTFPEAMTALGPRVTGAQSWMDLSTVVLQLVEAGALLDIHAPGAGPRAATVFDSPRIHTWMLDDRTRTDGYLAAIRETVGPDDVVLDLGTGTGVLATAAALAGARRVYALEIGDIGRLAGEVFEANGVADRVSLIRGWSTDVTLPQRATVLVSETLGNEPLGERILEYLLDARKRLLAPGARQIPASLTIWGVPVSVPRASLDAQTFQPEALDRWRAWYGVDFSPLLPYAGRVPQSLMVHPMDTQAWERLADPVALATVDFATFESPVVDVTVPFTIRRPGTLSGFLVFFEIGLSPSVTLTTNPEHTTDTNHWDNAVFLQPTPLAVEPGDRMAATYRYLVSGQTNGATVARVDA